MEYDFERTITESKRIFLGCSNLRGWASNDTVDILDNSRLDWLIDLSGVLSFWKEKAKNKMNNGELLLAYATLGALVEGWLKLFYCLYIKDYSNDNRLQNEKSGTKIAPNDLSFEMLKQFSRTVLWDIGDTKDLWVEKIQKRRNAIHAFNNRNIGTADEYISDVEEYCKFTQDVWVQFPDLPF